MNETKQKMPGFHLIQSTIKCQSSSVQTGSGSMFSPCKCKGSSSVSSSVTFHHSYTLLSGTVSKTKERHLGVPSHLLLARYKSKGSPNKLTSFYITCTRLFGVQSQEPTRQDGKDLLWHRCSGSLNCAG